MELLMDVSYHILIIGGALCILLILLILWYVLRVLMKTKGLVNNVSSTYEQAMFVTTGPLKKLMDRLGEDDDEEER